MHDFGCPMRQMANFFPSPQYPAVFIIGNNYNWFYNQYNWFYNQYLCLPIQSLIILNDKDPVNTIKQIY